MEDPMDYKVPASRTVSLQMYKYNEIVFFSWDAHPVKIKNLSPDNPEPSEGVNSEEDDKNHHDEAYHDSHDIILTQTETLSRHLPPV